jgi:TonB family protein
MRLTFLACFLALSAAYASSGSAGAESCGECTEQLLALWEKIAALPPKDARQADLLFRLGELHQRASEFYKSPDYQDTSTSGLDRFTQAGKARQKAEAQYARLVDEFPRSKRCEEALSRLVHLYLQDNRTQKALAASAQLSQEYPKSRFLPATHFAVGEHLFVRSRGQPEKLEKAREAYRKATEAPGSAVRFQALSMQGWCSFYLNDLADTRAVWMAAVLAHRAKAQRKSDDSRDRELFNPMLLDYVKVFAQVGDAAMARGDFSKLSSNPDERIALMLLLDLLYRESGSGKEREAAVTLAELDKDCKAGKARACNALGLLYMEGAGVEVDKPRASTFFEKACRSKLAVGCHNFCNPEVEKASANSEESRTAALRENACDDLDPGFGDEAGAQAFWEPLERVERRSPSAYSRLVGDAKDTPLSLALKGIDDRHRERMALYPEEESEEAPPERSSKASVDIPLPGQLDQWMQGQSSKGREEVRAVIASHRDQIQWCYEQALTRKPTLEGTFVVKFVVNAQGFVVRSETSRSSLEDTAMEACLVERVKTWRFPPLAHGGVLVVDYPFIFKQGPRPPPPR